MNLLLGNLLLVSTAFVAQSEDIPASKVPSLIINQFNADFPKADHADWEVKSNVYKVDFQVGWHKDFEVWYNAEGNKIRIKEESSKKELPSAIVQLLNKNYSSYHVEEVEKIVENNKVSYRVEIEHRNDEKTLLFNEKGNLIK